MPQKVPIRNIDPVVVDVKNPGVNYAWSRKHSVINLRRAPKERPAPSRVRLFMKAGAVGIALLLVLFLGYEGFRVVRAKDIVKTTGARIAQNFSVSVDALQEMNPEKASAALKANDSDIKELDRLLNDTQANNLFSILGKIVPLFRDSGSLVGHIGALNVSFLRLADASEALKKNGISYFQSDGASLIREITALRDAARSILSEAQAIKNATTNLKKVSSFFGTLDSLIGEKYLIHSAELYRLDAALGRILDIVGTDADRHIAFFFQNPAEIRPGGGFIGSYADMTVRGGQMTNLDVRDIYDPDGQFFGNIIPPYQMQTVTERWGARDANWFFDFPTSAKTVLSFLEASKMYSEKSITFDGALAVNIPVIKTLLEMTGGIPLPEYGLTITADNFLAEVQREVEAGKDKKAGQPKKILKVLTPLILERLETMDAGDNKELLLKFGEHIARKDIMAYAKDPELSSFLADGAMTGAVTELPNGFWGSYLAVVNANVAGGKTDAFMEQTIEAEVNIDTEGKLLTDVTVTRGHKGGNEKDPWWNADNKNFIQILANPGSNIVTMKGNTIKTLKSYFDYEANGFSENPDLQRIESTRLALPELNAWTMDEFGKKAFATWFTVPAGKTRSLTLRYHTDNTSDTVPEDGKPYTFLYERQSGVPTSLKATITAPLGFVWAESGTPVYLFSKDDVSGQESFVIRLKRQS